MYFLLNQHVDIIHKIAFQPYSRLYDHSVDISSFFLKCMMK